MLRTDSARREAQSQLPRVGVGTRTTRPGASKSNRRVRGEAVEMQEKRFGYFPHRFQWRGKSHLVQSVERCWTRTGRRAQLCFRVRCGESTFDLTQQVNDNVWTLSVVQ